MAKVMVVDDSAYARRVHRSILESSGYEVVEASTGMGALEIYFLERPDVVMLDLSMEDMGGLDVLRKLRQMDSSARVIVVSADIQRSTGEMALAAGAYRFVGKPVKAEELTTLLDALVKTPQ